MRALLLILIMLGCDPISPYDVRKPAFKLGLSEVQILGEIPSLEKHRYCSLQDGNAYRVFGITPRGRGITAIVCCGASPECTIRADKKRGRK